MKTRSSTKTYVVAACTPWSREIYQTRLKQLPGKWHLVESTDQLTASRLARIKPRYIFFLHWSWKVPEQIVSDYECVCFHMTDLPYGRGGSPLQNLILRGHRHTKLTAFRMTAGFDAGPVYLKRSLSLHGNAEAIYRRATLIEARAIERMIREHPVPVPQTGEAVVFKRRKPAESAISDLPSLESLYDFIRMLDAEGYPRAFVEQGGYRFEFAKASLRGGALKAAVTITPLTKTS